MFFSLNVQKQNLQSKQFSVSLAFCDIANVVMQPECEFKNNKQNNKFSYEIINRIMAL